ncbi:dynamin family protein [Actinokineospora cianjurensis]|uniref:Dynamin family protein n=1 Tax=Actinokineospora cianjurensis TaxID=585224 RepID=A0A421AVG1_9PSEU|nr:dynamin family protein [Actinokineospora cianjurensis]RLK53726.1 dynamin family protein [Actinokineospora cianjurensis]
MSHDVVRQVLRLANDTHGLAVRCERADVAGVLAAQAGRWSESTATVVVAGAQKRGKSRLVNALVGVPGLLPVDADIASETHIALSYGDELAASVRRGDEVEVIDPARLVEYASVLGDPALRRGVTGVEVTVDHPVLQGVRLVDTPGVDSLTAGHRHATVAALGGADALLFAVSAQDQPILRHELDFLAEAAARVHTIAFVMTKVEDSVGWRELLTENRERLARSVEDLDPRVGKRLLAAPWLPVSAKLAEAALALTQAGADERAAVRRERSGFPALERLIGRWALRRELIRAGGVLTVTTSAARDLAETAGDAAAVESADEAGVAARLSEVDAELADLAERRRARRVAGLDQHLVAREASLGAKAILDGYRRTYEAEIADLGSGRAIEAYLSALPDSLDQSLAAAWTEITAAVEDVATAAFDSYLRAMGVDAPVVDLAVLTRPDAPTSHAARPGAARFDVLAEGLPTVMMAGSVSYLATILGAAALSPLAPVAIGSALAVGFFTHKRRLAATTRTKAALTTAIRDTFTAATTDITLAVDRATLTWRTTTEQHIDEALTARHKALESRKRDLTTPPLGEGTPNLATATSLLDRAATLHDALESALRQPD